MRKIWKEELIDYRGRMITALVGFIGSLVLVVLLGRISSVKMSDLYYKLEAMPPALLGVIGFWRNKLMSDPQKLWMSVLLIENICMLFYAAFLPVRFLGEENENGTMAFLCNGPFGRKEIFWGKYAAELTVYSLLTAGLMFASAVVLLPGISSLKSVLPGIFSIYGMLYVTGIFIMSISTFYCSVKNATTCSGDMVLLWGCLDVLLGYVYIAVELIQDILEASGRIVVSHEVMEHILQGVTKFSVVQWCSPYEVYQKFPWKGVIGMILGTVCIMTVSGMIYRKKQFGESR